MSWEEPQQRVAAEGAAKELLVSQWEAAATTPGASSKAEAATLSPWG